MKKKFAIAFVAILAIVVCAVSFTACNGGNGDVKQLYESIFELRDKLSEKTTVSATELDGLNGTTVTVSGKALIAQRTDPDTNDVNYEPKGQIPTQTMSTMSFGSAERPRSIRGRSHPLPSSTRIGAGMSTTRR